MLFSKVAVPTLAVLGFATNVMALKGTIPAISVPKIPVGSVPAVPAVPANLPVKRSDLVLSTVQGVVANVAPLMDNLNKATTAVDVDAAIAAIVDLLANAKVDILGLVNVDIAADVNAIVAANVQLIVELLAALSVKDVLDLAIVAKIDAALSAYIDALVTVKAEIGVDIGHGIPVANVNVFGTLNLILTGHVLDLVQVPSI